MRRRTQNDLAQVVGLLMERLKQWGDLLDDPNTPPETVNKLAAALDKRTKVLETLQGVANFGRGTASRSRGDGSRLATPVRQLGSSPHERAKAAPHLSDPVRFGFAKVGQSDEHASPAPPFASKPALPQNSTRRRAERNESDVSDRCSPYSALVSTYSRGGAPNHLLGGCRTAERTTAYDGLIHR